MQAFVINRNRLSSTESMVAWFHKYHIEPIIFDNDSTYPPLLEWYLQRPCDVIRFNQNFGYGVGWDTGILGRLAREEFILTDSDLDLSSIPDDWLMVLRTGLERYGRNKAGFSLEIADLPEHFRLKESVIQWEQKFWTAPLDPLFYDAHIDTTFALYRHRCAAERPHNYAVRTARPYTARHLPWYQDTANLPPEEAYYVEHAWGATAWTGQIRAMRQTMWTDCVDYGIQQKEAEWKDFLEYLRPLPHETIVEVGSYTGGTAVGFSTLATQLISIDQLSCRFETALIRGRCEYHYIQGQSGDVATLAKCRAVAAQPVDVLFIDADHSYLSVSRDFEVYRRLVRSGGIIAFHDIQDSQSHRDQGCEVSTFWSHVRRLFPASEICHPPFSWGGIGILNYLPGDLPRSAILFASFIPTLAALEVGKEMLDFLVQRFWDCDLYVGVNPPSLSAWETLIQAQWNGRFSCVTVPDHLVVDSDASAFQTALYQLAQADVTYDVVWLVHTKGATNSASHDLRARAMAEFLSQRRRIEADFKENDRLGAHGWVVTLGQGALNAELDNLFPFSHARAGPYFLYTFYAIRGSIVRRFLDGCAETFLRTNLVQEQGFDRYFFERDFAAIAEKMGYDFTYDVVLEHPHFRVPVTRSIVETMRHRTLSGAPSQLDAIS